MKVILETALLERAEKVRAALLAAVAGAVKTSTGFYPPGGGGATVEDVGCAWGPSVAHRGASPAASGRRDS